MAKATKAEAATAPAFEGGRVDPLDGGLAAELFEANGCVLPAEGWGFLQLQAGDPDAFVDPDNEELGKVGRNGLLLSEVRAFLDALEGRGAR